MSKGKLKTIVVSITIVAMLAIVGMVVGLTSQFVTLSSLKKQNRALEQEIARIREYTPSVEDEISFFSNKEALEDYYRQQGYSKSGDTIFGE